MKYIFLCVMFSFLLGCRATVPSESISNSAISDLKAITKQVDTLDNTITQECKSQAFLNGLNGIKTQIESVGKQIENISLSCQTEKNVLEQKITVRNVIILLLGVILGFLVYLRLRLK